MAGETEQQELSEGLVHALLADEDGICSDPNCYHCHSPLRPENLRRLASNLAVAGALCRSWELGRIYGSDPHMDGPTEWAPGCGQEATR